MPMKICLRVKLWSLGFAFLSFALVIFPWATFAAEKFITIYSARVMSQSMPWIAQEAGLFSKYNLDFHLVHIASSGMVTAAMPGGGAAMPLACGGGKVLA